MSLTLNADDSSDDVVIRFGKRLDESDRFPSLKVRLSQQVIFDCENLVMVSSAAIQNWILWMRSLDPRTQFVFKNCHRKVIEMINAVHGFWPKEAKVESFYLPFTCDKCEHEEEVLLVRGRDFIESMDGKPARFLATKTLNCGKCRETMEVAVLEDMYLQFLHYQRKQ